MHCTKQPPSFDLLVGDEQQAHRYFDAERFYCRLGGLEIDVEVDFFRPLDRQIGGFYPLPGSWLRVVRR